MHAMAPYFLNTASYTADTPDTAVPTKTPLQPLYSAELILLTHRGFTTPQVTPCAYTTYVTTALTMLNMTGSTAYSTCPAAAAAAGFLPLPPPPPPPPPVCAAPALRLKKYPATLGSSTLVSAQVKAGPQNAAVTSANMSGRWTG